MDNAKILVVEDERVVALDIKRMLQRSGYNVLAPAATGEAAIHRAVKEQPDLVLMDIKLTGGMDGIAAASEIRRRLDIPVIYLTAFYDDETLHRAKLTEPYGYLLKPFNENELNTTLQMSLYRHRLEQQLKEQEQWLAATLNSIGEGVVTADTQDRIKSMNPAAQELTGWTEDEAVGKPWGQVVQLTDQKAADRESGIPFHQPGAALTDYWLLAKTSTRIPVDANIHTIRDQHGRSCGTVVTLRDVTARQRFQQAEAEKQEFYRALFDKNHAVMLLIDPETARIVDANPAACSFYGYRKTELTAKKITEINTLPEPQVRAEMARARAEKRTLFHSQHRLSNGDLRQVDVQSGPIKVGDRQLLCSIIYDVTERQRLEAELRQREASYRTVVEYQTDLICRFLPDTRLTFVNEAYCRYWGKLRAELLGQSFLALLPEGAHSAITTQIDSLITNPRTLVTENPYVFANGRVIWQQWTNQPLFDAEGRVVEIQAIGRDITERKQAEEALLYRNRELTLLNHVIAASVDSAEPEKFLESTCRELAQAFDLSHVAALLVDTAPQTLEVVASYAAQKVPPLPGNTFSFGPDSLLQAVLTSRQPVGVADINNEPGLAKMRNLLNQLGLASLLLLPLTVEVDVIGFLALAATVPRHFSESQIDLGRTVAGQIAGALTRIQLQKQRRQLSAVLEQTAEGVVVTDQSGAILYVNPAFEQITGYSQAEVIGQNPRILKSGRHTADFYQELWQTITAGQIWQGRFINKKKDGSLYTEEATINPIRDEQGVIVNYVAVRRDVTRELQLEEQYRQAHKMEAIGLLAGGIAHDFNNILTGINGFGELLQMQLPLDSPYQEPVARIIKGGQRAADLVRQLLAFSRKQVIQPKIVDLNSLVSDLERMLQRLIGEHIRLTTGLASQLWSIKADPTQLEQVALNLAINARDAMPNGGQLKFETANITLADETVAGQLELPLGEFVRLTVSDTGIGMSAEVKAHLFEPFFTTKELGQGTGLGLATVYGIVKQNSGSILVDSQPGQGTIFQIYLPRAAEDVISQHRSEWTLALPQGSETILLVEDETHVRELAATMLNRQGYRVLTAVDGIEALKLAGELGDQINLLVTDVIMPRLNGPELAARLKEKLPDLKVLYVSGYADEMIARHGVLEPDVALLPKPFSVVHLAQKVGQVLGSSAAGSTTGAEAG